MSNPVAKGDAADKSQDELRAMIESFFRFAHVQVPWDGTVNDSVALVFHQMLLETAKCSKAMSFVPRPAGGPPSVLWLATQLATTGYRNIENKFTVSCAKKVIGNFRSPFELAATGIAALRFMPCA
ncbi:hypothetical protein AVMA1855_06775 [Acidovorax sp. SUPP1855]|uniref:hypothetical protein n=1 Tax=unclassified Acidovorax TaxID=2684926 RepID=UPI0023DE4796|nr:MULTISPECIES: hypothetical protein [unclassified Acidovorax]GKS83829.1 hypothetical protein AVMA1855_06775 [Acidovorax sp. SUPP1855]GKT02413.1 hypothetical protein AVKW3434_23510 [Acidovorax sp. SUPP3434]